MDRMFLYDAQSKTWEDVAEHSFLAGDGELTRDARGLIFVRQEEAYVSDSFSANKDGRLLVWDWRREECLEVMECVGMQSVKTEHYEVLTGIVGAGIVELDAFGRPPTRLMSGAHHLFLPARWRVQQSENGGLVLVTLDVMKVYLSMTDYCRKVHNVEWEHWNINIDAVRGRIVGVPHAFAFSAKDEAFLLGGEQEEKEFRGYARAVEFNFPDPVMTAVLECLQNQLNKAWGIRPAILSEAKGKDFVRAFVRRPFDPNIVYQERMFEGLEFERIFPREGREYFRPLCTAFGIAPPRSIRKLYLKKPYALAMWLVMQELGFRDINFIRPFCHLDHFCDMDLAKFRFHKQEQEDEGRISVSYVENRWEQKEYEDFRRCMNFIVQAKGEGHAAKLLRNAIQTDWEQPQRDLPQMVNEDLARYFDAEKRSTCKLPHILLEEFLEKGFTRSIHDKIIEAQHKIAQEKIKEPIVYTKGEERYRAKVCGYDFRVPAHCAELVEVANDMHNCVRYYAGKVANRETTIVYAMKDDRCVICIELWDNLVAQALGRYNKELTEEEGRVCAEWARCCGLHFKGREYYQGRF